MQNYGQQPPAAYQRPGSTNSFTGAPAPPPYHGAPPSQDRQWGAPPQNQSQNHGPQWNQSQQPGGYNPNVYGAMPGGYAQGQQVPTHDAPTYPAQQNIPPPPPPKPAGFAAAVAQQQVPQNYGQQQQHGYGAQPPQQNTGYSQGIGGYAPQGGYQAQSTQQQSYNNAAPPPPSQTPGGSYFPPSEQPPPLPARPGSVLSASQAGSSSTPVSAVSQPPPPQNQPYAQGHTNPTPGTYAPPQSNVPAWQQSQHQPPQGGSAYDYTKPGPALNVYTQGYQGNTLNQQGQYGPAAQNQYTPQTPVQQGQYGQQGNSQYPPAQHNQYGQTTQPEQAQAPQPPAQYPQQTSQSYNQFPPQSSTPQQPTQQPSQWGPPPPADQGYGQQHVQQPVQQQGWQQGHQPQDAFPNQQQSQGQNAGVQAPTPMGSHTGTTAPGFVNETSPQSQPVSPLVHRKTMSFGPGQGQGQTQHGYGRTDSVSSIALSAIHAQRAGNRTQSPRPTPANAPPPRDNPERFSALGQGGPSDWEHFGGEEEVDDEELYGLGKEDKKDHSASSYTAELPAQVPEQSIPSGFPSPPDQPLPLNIQRRDQFQPTPDLSGRGTPTQRPSSQPPQQPIHNGGWQTPKQGTPVQQHNYHHPPPASQQNSGVNDGGWSASSVPAQQPSQLYAGVDQGAHLEKANQELKDAINAEKDAYNALAKEMEKQKNDLKREIDELNIVIETVKKHAETERNVSGEQTKKLQAAIEQGKAEKEAMVKEKDSIIERWKEDAEGKDNNVKEKESEIVNLNQQLRDQNATNEQTMNLQATIEQIQTEKEAIAKEKDAIIERWKEDAESKDSTVKEKENEIDSLNNQLREQNAKFEELTRELEAEKSRVPPKPTAADLISDIDPWYAGSLERYITMLRGEANEAIVDDKIKTFTAFMKAESAIRGLEYYNAPPPVPAASQSAQNKAEQPAPVDKRSVPAAKDLNIQVPQQAQPEDDDDFQYSPGGRPMLQRQATVPFTDNVSTQPQPSASGDPSGHAGTVLTPTSSQDDDSNHLQPLYKAYVPPSGAQTDSTRPVNRHTPSFATTGTITPLQPAGPGKNNDEVFFGGHASQTSSRPGSRPATVTPSEIPLPLPLSTSRPLQTSTPAPTTQNKDPLTTLKSLLPKSITPSKPSPQLEKVRQKLDAIPSDTTFISTLTTAWEKTAAAKRKSNADARHKRQEDSEQHTDDLFNNHEISYADIGALEDEFQEQERELKAQEDRDEYTTYDSAVFEKVYATLQEQIKSLSDLYIDAESLLQTSETGIRTLDGDAYGGPTMHDALQLVRDTHAAIETRHAGVAAAVAERDRRYKKTEVSPLYAAGNIAKMKAVEKHFEAAEKEGIARAAEEKSERVREVVGVVGEIVVGGIGVEQGEIEAVGLALRELDGHEEELGKKAKDTIAALKESSKALLKHLHALDLDLLAADSDAAIARARAENASASRIAELEKERKERERESDVEFERKVGIVDSDDLPTSAVVVGGFKKDGGAEQAVGRREEPEELVEDVEETEEEKAEREKKERLRRALEAAKRRNGDL